MTATKTVYQPHQQRVIDEMTNLDTLVTKLNAFLNSDKANEVDPQERSFMQGQLQGMQMYLSFGRARIAHWDAVARPVEVTLETSIPMPQPGDGALFSSDEVPDPNPAASAAGSTSTKVQQVQGTTAEPAAVAARVGGSAPAASGGKAKS